jgi:hypothetical protein
MIRLLLLNERQMARNSPHFLHSHGMPRVDDRGVVKRHCLRDPQRSAMGVIAQIAAYRWITR